MMLLNGIFLSFSLFSRLPVPQVEWSKESRRFVLCAFPLVGLLQGLLLAGWGLAAARLSLPPLLVAVGFTLLPVAYNGGIHLDGLCDTADALASRASRERKLEIMGDPHIGAFGVLALVSHLLLCVALYSALPLHRDTLLGLPLLHALSRAWSGYAVLRFPSARPGGLADALACGGPAASRMLLATALAASAGLAALLGLSGALTALAALAVLRYYRRMAIRQLGGITGDLAGWFLQTCELWMLAALVLGGMIL